MAIKKYIDEVHPEVDFCQLGIRHVLKAGVKAGKFTKVRKSYLPTLDYRLTHFAADVQKLFCSSVQQ